MSLRMSSLTSSTWTQSCFTLGLVHPTTPATPRMRPLMMLSLSGRIGGPEGPAQHVIDVFMGEPVDPHVPDVGDLDGQGPILEADDGFFNDAVRTFPALVLDEIRCAPTPSMWQRGLVVKSLVP